MIPEVKLGDRLVCPICGQEFMFTEDTKYIFDNEYACNWKCFLEKVKKCDEERKNKAK